jgi:hypothetical protein
MIRALPGNRCYLLLPVRSTLAVFKDFSDKIKILMLFVVDRL